MPPTGALPGRPSGWISDAGSWRQITSARSVNPREQPLPTHRPGQPPEAPDALALLDREIDPRHAADHIGDRHHAVLRGHPAVARVLAIVAEHEQLPGRNGEDLGVVQKAVLDEIDGVVADAFRQRLAPALAAHGAPVLDLAVVADELARHGLAVDVQRTLDHQDAVATE